MLTTTHYGKVTKHQKMQPHTGNWDLESANVELDIIPDIKSWVSAILFSLLFSFLVLLIHFIRYDIHTIETKTFF